MSEQPRYFSEEELKGNPDTVVGEEKPKMLTIDTDDFTNKQKVIFLTISVKHLVARLKRLFVVNGNLMSRNEELAEEVTELTRAVERRDVKIYHMQKEIKKLKNKNYTQQSIIDSQRQYRK